jgi:tight adherence protein B
MVLAAICMMGAVLVAAATPQRDRLARLDEARRASESSRSRVFDQWVGCVPALWSRQRRHDLTQLAVIDVADAWAAELQAGSAPAPALVSALDEAPAPLPAGADQIRLGGDPVRALLQLSRAPGAEGLASLAACWTLASTAGAGLSEPARRVALGLRDERAVEQELRAQVAAPKATARLVAALPIAGPLLGALVGADTIGVLLTTTAGRSCLVVGLALNLIGLWWVRRIIASVAPS